MQEGPTTRLENSLPCFLSNTSQPGRGHWRFTPEGFLSSPPRKRQNYLNSSTQKKGKPQSSLNFFYRSVSPHLTETPDPVRVALGGEICTEAPASLRSWHGAKRPLPGMSHSLPVSVHPKYRSLKSSQGFLSQVVFCVAAFRCQRRFLSPLRISVNFMHILGF